MGEVLLKIENLNKSFGVTHANVNINFEIKRGEVRGLAGENGSGKSTLLSQIAGILESDSGTMYMNGKEYKPQNSLDANNHKIAMVVQELGMIGGLSAGINAYLGKTKAFINTNDLQRQANAVAERWGLPKPKLGRVAANMNIENRKMVELIRALAADPDVLILDEVTQSLSHDNREGLYALIRKMKEEGCSVILISHDLEEEIMLTDSISVLRDGELIETVSSEGLTEDILRNKMIGRELSGSYYREDWEDDYDENDVIFSLDHVSTESGIKDLNLQLHRGEILAFCGLSDSGIHDVGQIAYGLMPLKEGRVRLDLDNIEIKEPITALKHQMAYVPKDRDGEAMMMNASIMANFSLPSAEDLVQKGGRLRMADIRKFAEKNKEDFSVKCIGIDQNVSGLSGGNKQKVNLGRWLGKDLHILIVDCPTRGVDVGVKAYIYECMRQAKKKGVGTIMITDELSEARGMADNIVVMRNGEVKREIKRSSGFAEEDIIEVML
ncbi:MAG: sugar ABC transporter ATP-binding protein [Lachnospiraceae bacterium]|nr:sugar ABC transporter ATP-binding protein [Lachnospiraceae bacterium]